MANTVVISRSHLIYGICVPLAVLIGYLLAEPLESGSIAVVVLVCSVLSIPLLMRWHHELLIFSCNALILPIFIPGRPSFCMIMACVSMLFLVLNRAMGQDVRFFRARRVSLALIAIVIVTLATAYATGGIGFALFGATNAGGKRYLGLLTGVFVYFGLSTITIQRKHAGLAVAAFFLSSLTGLVGYLAAIAGPGLYFLVELFPIEGAVNETTPNLDPMAPGFTRLGGLSMVAIGVFCFVLARFGVRGTLDLSKPWRLALLLLAMLANLYSGFRSAIIMSALVFLVIFYLEGLFRTRYFLVLALVALLAGAIVLPYSQKLPLVAQRALAFLPINIDPDVRLNAEGSTDWRLDMWREVLPTVPKYLIKGKGYGMDQNDQFLIQQAALGGFSKNYEGAMLAGDYHSGPLSVIVPFGIFGVLAFSWFLFASLKVLRQNYRFGDPALKHINTFFFAYFVVRIVSFLFVFGSLHSDLVFFTGLIGLSVSLNGGVCQPPEPALEQEPE